MNDKNIFKSIARLQIICLEKSNIRSELIEYIKKFPISGRKKSILFGWGDRNFNARISQHVPDNKLIECIEKLMAYDNESNVR